MSNNIARAYYDPISLAYRGYVPEAARTNQVVNNSATGGSAGTPGTLPTGWATTGTGLTGLTRQIVAVTTENGIPCIDIRYSGTSAGGPINIVYGPGGAAATTGQVWTVSAAVKLVGGSLSNLSGWQLMIDEGNPGFLRNTAIPITAPTSALLRTQRQSGQVTIGASTTQISNHYLQVTAAAAAVDFTIRMGLMQTELGALNSTPVLTTGAAVTCNADVLTYPNTGNVFAGAGTIYAELTSFVVGNSPTTRVAVGTSTGANGLSIATSQATTGIAAFDGTNSVQKTGLTDMRTGVRKRISSWGIGQNVTGDGVAVTSGAFDGDMNPTGISIGCDMAGGRNWSGTIMGVRLWPTQLPTAEHLSRTA